MRTLRMLALVLLVALVVVPSIVAVSSSESDSAVLKNAPGKVCHPKSPVPCKTQEMEQAMLCIPRVACGVSNSLTDATAAAPRVESQQAMLCIPRVACGVANTLA